MGKYDAQFVAAGIAIGVLSLGINENFYNKNALCSASTQANVHVECADRYAFWGMDPYENHHRLYAQLSRKNDECRKNGYDIGVGKLLEDVHNKRKEIKQGGISMLFDRKNSIKGLDVLAKELQTSWNNAKMFERSCQDIKINFRV